jgi:hypothetical protein
VTTLKETFTFGGEVLNGRDKEQELSAGAGCCCLLFSLLLLPSSWLPSRKLNCFPFHQNNPGSSITNFKRAEIESVSRWTK